MKSGLSNKKNVNIDTVRIIRKIRIIEKRFANFDDFSSMIFWSPTVLILPYTSLLIPLDQNVHIFVNIVGFYFVLFWTKTVLILLEQNLSMP